MHAILGAAAIAASVAATSASAITATVNDLISTRNGALHFMDSFNDGLAPPNSPNFASGAAHTYYIGAGTLMPGAEAGGKLTLNSDWGSTTTSANGSPSSTLRLTVQSNTDPSNPASGLKPHHTFAVSALVDIAGASGQGSIQLRLDDRTSPIQGPQVIPSTVNEMISIDFISSNQTVRFRRQDFVDDTVTTISTIAIPTLADQVRLMLLHPSANVNLVYAAAEFFDDGQSLGVYALPGQAQIFEYSQFTRIELAAAHTVVAVPEPETYAMMLVGVGLVGWQLRRRARATRGRRLI